MLKPRQKLSKAQAEILQRPERVIYRPQSDATMNALARMGFATFHSGLGETYGRPSWWITDAGRAAAPIKPKAHHDHNI